MNELYVTYIKQYTLPSTLRPIHSLHKRTLMCLMYRLIRSIQPFLHSLYPTQAHTRTASYELRAGDAA